MKYMKIAVTTVLWSVALVNIGQAQDFLYRSDGSKHFLSVSKKSVSVKIKPLYDVQEVAQFLNSLDEKSSRGESEIMIHGFLNLPIDSNINIAVLDKKLREYSGIQKIQAVYESNGKEVHVFDDLLVKFHPDVANTDIEVFCNSNDVTIISRNPYRPKEYKFRIDSNSVKNSVEMANSFFERFNCVWATPDALLSADFPNTNPEDIYFAQQYWAHNTGQQNVLGLSGTADVDIDLLESWNITLGTSNIVIAVIGQGVGAHEDLPSSRLVSGFDYAGYELISAQPDEIETDSDPSPDGNESHEMFSAGMIAATHNNIGIAGIAPKCKIMPIKVSDKAGQITIMSFLGNAVDFANANGADVIYGGFVFGVTSESDYSNPLYAPLLSAIEAAMQDGREGKGCVVAWPIGNYANRPGQYFPPVAIPANVPGVVSVGAIDFNGNVWKYSTRSALIDIVAPAGGIGNNGDIWTLDIQGIPGYNPGNYNIPEFNNYSGISYPKGDLYPPGNYFARFGGTSSAGPQAAGVAALVLSVNPNLTQEQVVSFIKDAATPSGNPLDYGAGRLNVYQALLEVGVPDILAPSTGSGVCENSQFIITWHGRTGKQYDIWLSTDGGQNFPTQIANSVSGSDEVYNFNWTVTQGPTTTAVLRIVETVSTTFQNIARFEIQSGTPSTPGSFYLNNALPGHPHLSWTASSNASGYYIWRALTEFGMQWSIVADIDNTSTTSWTDLALQTQFPATQIAYYKMQAYNACDESSFTTTKSINVQNMVKRIADANPKSQRFQLEAAYPNPFNPRTRISYSLNEIGHVSLAIYDILGRHVRRLVDQTKPVGEHSSVWNGRDDNGNIVSSGVYIYRLIAKDRVATRKMLFLK